MEYQPKKFFGKINFSSNDQYKVKRPNYEYPEKKEKEEMSEKKVFYNSKMDATKESNLKELDTKDDLFLNKFVKVTSSQSIGFSSSNENSLQNMPFINSQKKKKDKEKIEINYEDMEIENRDDINSIEDDNEDKNNTNEKVEVKTEVKKMIIIQRNDNIEIDKQTPNKNEKNTKRTDDKKDNKVEKVNDDQNEEEEEEEDDEKEEKKVKGENEESAEKEKEKINKIKKKKGMNKKMKMKKKIT